MCLLLSLSYAARKCVELIGGFVGSGNVDYALSRSGTLHLAPHSTPLLLTTTQTPTPPHQPHRLHRIDPPRPRTTFLCHSLQAVHSLHFASLEAGTGSFVRSFSCWLERSETSRSRTLNVLDVSKTLHAPPLLHSESLVYFWSSVEQYSSTTMHRSHDELSKAPSQLHGAGALGRVPVLAQAPAHGSAN